MSQPLSCPLFSPDTLWDCPRLLTKAQTCGFLPDARPSYTPSVRLNGLSSVSLPGGRPETPGSSELHFEAQLGVTGHVPATPRRVSCCLRVPTGFGASLFQQGRGRGCVSLPSSPPGAALGAWDAREFPPPLRSHSAAWTAPAPGWVALRLWGPGGDSCPERGHSFCTWVSWL